MTLKHRPSKNGSRHRNTIREHSCSTALHSCARVHYETLRWLYDDGWKNKTGTSIPDGVVGIHRKGGDTHPRYLRHASILIRLLQSTSDLQGRMPEEPEIKRATQPFRRRERDSNPRDFHPTVFKTVAIDHSAIPPKMTIPYPAPF